MDHMSTQTPGALEAPITDALRRIRKSSGVSLAFGGVVDSGSRLRLQHFLGNTVGALKDLYVDGGQGLGGKVIAVSRPMIVDDYLHAPRITHRYNEVIAAEGLRAIAAAPVIVDRRPVAVLYGALHTTDPLGSRMLDILSAEARAVEQHLVAARVALESQLDATPDVSELRDRLGNAYARLRMLTARAGSDLDPAVLAELEAIGSALVDEDAPSRTDIELTGRERDVLSLAAIGYSNGRIAETLGVTVYTAKSYMRDAMAKLGSSTRLEAVVVARRAGLLPG